LRLLVLATLWGHSSVYRRCVRGQTLGTRGRTLGTRVRLGVTGLTVSVKQSSQVFSCTCCHQQRMGMPCRHIASVCRGNDTILGHDPLGFPLSSIRVFWWNQYYLYGMSEKEEHQKIRGGLLALADNDTQGLPCLTSIGKPMDFPCPDWFMALFHLPATDRLLNYMTVQQQHMQHNP
jgi:hypothetical protein